MTNKLQKPVVNLLGADGNAFMILALSKKAMRSNNWSKEKIDQVIEEMMNGDYDHLLQTAMKYFEVR